MPLRRYIFNTLTVLSLLLLLGTVGLWVDSGSNRIFITYRSALQYEPSFVINSQNGRVYLSPNDHRFISSVVQQEGWEISRGPATSSGMFSEMLIHLGPNWDGNLSLYLSHWFLVLLFAILPTIWFIKWHERRKLGDNICSHCGYDLTGNESGKCSECGEVVETTDMEARGAQP